MPNPLDNPIWHALTGPHAGLALGRGAARRYPQTMAPFAAIAEPTAAAYADLAADLPPDTDVLLFRAAEETLPPGWTSSGARQLEQMILPSRDLLAEPLSDPTPEPLGAADAAEMLSLVDITQPGPFAPRAAELGNFAGIRDPGGRLIAMAGERFHLPSHVEISAICVHPDARGKGLGAALTRHVARAIFDRGKVPILHVWPDNPARALYVRTGFQHRAPLWVLWRRPIAA